MRCRTFARVVILALAAATASCATHAAVGAIAPVPGDTAPARPLPPLRVFVGRLTAASPKPYTFSDGSALFDTGWTLRYEVLQAVRGEFDESATTFDYWGHGGLTEFGRYDRAGVRVRPRCADRRTRHGPLSRLSRGAHDGRALGGLR